MLLVLAKNLLFHVVCLRRADRYLELKGRIVRGVARMGGYERAFMRLLPSLARPGSDVIDAGANVGAYTMALARVVGSSGRVFAFEPVPPVAGVLERACRRLPNVTVIREILSDRPLSSLAIRVPVLPGGVPEPALATVEEEAPATGAGEAGWATFGAAASPLDGHLARFRDVSFIKVDVEGHEPSFLAGAVRTIQAFRPVLQVEARGLESNASYVGAWLDEHDYAMFSLTGRGFEESAPGGRQSLNVYLVPREAVARLPGLLRGPGSGRR